MAQEPWEAKGGVESEAGDVQEKFRTVTGMPPLAATGSRTPRVAVL